MNTTAASRRTRAGSSVANQLHRRVDSLRRARMLLWAGLLHRLARALAAISEELARRTAQRRDGRGLGAAATSSGARAPNDPTRPGLRPPGQLRGEDVPRHHPPHHLHPAPTDVVAATERHHGSLSRADVLTGAGVDAAAPHEVGWPAVGSRPATWTNATRARAGTGATPSRCLLRARPAPRALRYDPAARCAPRGPWRPLG